MNERGHMAIGFVLGIALGVWLCGYVTSRRAERFNIDMANAACVSRYMTKDEQFNCEGRNEVNSMKNKGEK